MSYSHDFMIIIDDGDAVFSDLFHPNTVFLVPSCKDVTERSEEGMQGQPFNFIQMSVEWRWGGHF